MLVHDYSDTAFAKRLAETIQWCTKHADPDNPKSCLRTPLLQPTSNHILQEGFEFPPNEKYLSTKQVVPLWYEEVLSRQLMVETVTRCRRQQTSHLLEDVNQLHCPLHEGRLLLYFTDFTNHNGGSEHESLGFFDENDEPPWDTWVAYYPDPDYQTEINAWSRKPLSFPAFSGLRPVTMDFVVAWIPPNLIDIAQKGIDVEAMGCLCWLDNIFDTWPQMILPDYLPPYLP
jgi:hypothetical protein